MNLYDPGKKNRSLHKKVLTITVIAAAAAIMMPVGAFASEGALQPTEDYSYYAEPSVDSDGYLHLTDNQTITDISVTKLKMKNFEFSIPGVWAGNVVIRTLYMNQTKSSNLYKTQIVDSYVIRFYEKETWEKYQSDDFRKKKNASSMGEIAEIRLMNSSENDTSRWKNDPMYIYFGTITGEKSGYDAFLYRPKASDGLIDTDYASRYGYLSDINYQGCLISSFSCSSDFALKYPNAYIKNHYITDFNKNEEGMKKGSTIPDNYTPKTLTDEKNSSDEAPEKLNTVSENVSANAYSWGTFTSPWEFSDRGSAYYQSLMSSISQISAIPTVTVTPTLTQTPTPSAAPTVTEAPTATPRPTTEPEAEETPETTSIPAPTETPTPEVTSVPTNPEPEEDEE